MCNTRLKIAIIESGRKGYEIANSLNWHQTKVSQIVIGAVRPSADDKRQLANALGKSVAQLFNTNQDPVHA
jgi:transcriptional regulator with XRE-family HTH domain